MFSIIVPLYNKESYIQRTMESILAQSFVDFELVIVNDGSTDSSVEIVQAFDDPRIRLINKDNGGVSSARNLGITEATFEWIAFIDADDMWHKDKLKAFHEIIATESDLEWLASGYKLLKGSTTISYVYKHNGRFSDVIDDFAKGLEIHTSTVVVRRSLFLADPRLLFPVGINNSEDREVWYRLALRFPQPYYIQDVLSYYVHDELGLSLTSRLNFSYLSLIDRLKDEILMTTVSRRKIILSYLEDSSNYNCWKIWVSNGWQDQFSSYLPKTDEFIMRNFTFFPNPFRRIFFLSRRVLFKIFGI